MVGRVRRRILMGLGSVGHACDTQIAAYQKLPIVVQCEMGSKNIHNKEVKSVGEGA